MKRPFIDDLMELCEGRGYHIRSVDIDGEVVEVIFNHERKGAAKKSSIPEDFRIKETSAV